LRLNSLNTFLDHGCLGSAQQLAELLDGRRRRAGETLKACLDLPVRGVTGFLCCCMAEPGVCGMAQGCAIFRPSTAGLRFLVRSNRDIDAVRQ